MNTTQTTQKLSLRKDYGRNRWDLNLKEGQSVRFLDKDNCILGELEIRDGEMYLMRHPSLKGHTWAYLGE